MTFDAIYRENLWNGVESRSGPGSGKAATGLLVGLLPVIALELGASSVLDIGCGDGFWMPDLPGYIGADVSKQAIRLAKRRHGRRRRYLVADYRSEVPPAVDLVIVRDVLQHLSHASGVALLHNIEASGSGWLLASTYLETDNVDIPDGSYAEPCLMRAPYSLPWPERLYPDGFHYHDTGAQPPTRDPRKQLGLWQLGALWLP